MLSLLATLPVVANAQAKQTGTPANSNAKIRNAVAAAPASIGANATIMDWPAKDDDQHMKLRDGTNGFTCFPDMPMTEGNDPMCVDSQWMAWMDAYMGKKPFKADRIGIGYMVAPGGASGSNTDPYAMGPTATNEWGLDAPHVMILVPDAAHLQGLPTKRQTGSPWVMWKGTPYAHIMVPVVEAKKP